MQSSLEYVRTFEGVINEVLSSLQHGEFFESHNYVFKTLQEYTRIDIHQTSNILRYL